MIRTRCTYLLFALICSGTIAQNMQILYDFDDLPQTLLLNPGIEIDIDRHLGIPLLSNIYMDFGSSNKAVNYNSVFGNADNIDEALRNVKDLDLSPNDVFSFNQQIEVFTMGFRLKDPTYYLDFGMVERIYGFSAYPKDFGDLFFDGNDQNNDGIPEINERFLADQINSVGELVGVFHVGINKKVNEKWTLGARLKLLSGSIGLETSSNKGDYYLDIDPNPLSGEPFLHNYERMNTSLNTSGLLRSSDLTNNVGELSELIAGLFFVNGSMGLAFDVGFSHKLTDKIDISGSVLDIGMIQYKHMLTNINVEDDVIALPEYYNPPQGNELDYWRSLYAAQFIPLDTSEDSYSYFWAPKLNAAVKYSMSRKTKGKNSAFSNVACDGNFDSKILESALGIQLYSEFRPSQTLWAVTAFYSRELSHWLNTKITYTVDRFSAKNVGLGFSVHINSFNFYATADNLLALPQIDNSNYQSFQFGLNFIFK